MSKINYGQNMLLFNTFHGQMDTFKLMPITNECPFAEVLYHKETDLLVVISKHQQEKFEMIPRLDDNGDYMMVKSPRKNGKPWKEERRHLKLPHEYYIADRKEQEDFIKAWAINSDSFDYLKHLDEKKNEIITKIEKPALVDDKGALLKSSK
jgi:hypothetical protein